MKITALKDIMQVSYGIAGTHFLAKDSQNKIFVTGSNIYGQLGSVDLAEKTYVPKEMDPKHFNIWGNLLKSRAKSARK